MTLRHIRTVLVAAALATGAAPALAQEGASGPTTQPTTQPSTRPARSIEAVMMDIQGMQQDLAAVMNDPRVLSDPEMRDEASDEAVPLLRRLVGLMNEAVASAPPQLQTQLKSGVYQVQALLVGFGDDDTRKALEAEEGVDAKAAMTLGEFIAGDGTPEKLEAVKQLDALATENPENPGVAQAAIGMVSLSQGNAEVTNAAKVIIREKLRGQMAEQLKMMLQQMEMMERATTQPGQQG